MFDLYEKKETKSKATNGNLHKAKVNKNDEFYTQLTDIEKELMHYKEHFKDKIVYCNCDDPEWSNFWKYFHLNFAHLGLKKLIATFYHIGASVYKMEYTGGDDNNISAGVKIPLTGNGEFRSEECIETLKESDIVVGNPPFSLARPFVEQLVTYNKKFLIIGDLNWITYKEIFPLIKNNEIWLGFNYVKEFTQPDGTIKKFGNKLWFTNLDHSKRHEKLPLWKNYTPKEYPKYDNYDAINVDKVTDIPCDYCDLIGVPITFMNSYCPEQFEIVGTISAPSDKETLNLGKDYSDYIGYNQDRTPYGRTGSTFGKCPVIVMDDKKHPYYEKNGVRVQATYHRIFIRRKD